MDFRLYDPAIGRFNGIDPVTHHSQGTSVAFDNNPIFWADPSGANSTAEWMEENGITDDDLITVYESSDNSEGNSNSESESNCPECETFEDYYNYYSSLFKSPVAQERAKKGLEDTGTGALKGVLSNFNIETTEVTDAEEFGFFAGIVLFALLEPGPGGEAKLAKKGFSFWSGRGSQKAALDAGYKVLGDTRAGQNLAKLTANMEYSIGSQAWKNWARLSQAYARKIPKGSSVNVFLTRGNNANPMSIWSRFERPILEQNNVKIIYNFID